MVPPALRGRPTGEFRRLGDARVAAIEVDFPVKPRHMELKMLHAEVQQRISEFNGQLGSWLLKSPD